VSPRADIARQALTAALRLRQRGGIAVGSPLCPFDLAEQLGIEVRFTDIASLEGMYVEAERPLILVAADRPAGRQAYTCAHELGHRCFRHGSRVDHLLLDGRPGSRFDPEEFAADAFGGFLLMPKSAVTRGFVGRGWRPERCTAEQAYVVAGWLGVSYEALVTHLVWSLRLMERSHAEGLIRAHLADIRASIVGQDVGAPLVVADRQWTGRAIDVCVGDYILAPAGPYIPDALLEHAGEQAGGRLLRAVRPGVGRLLSPDGGWSSFVRVARKGYAGRATYRHLEDPDCD
jgi:hypothetical protein